MREIYNGNRRLLDNKTKRRQSVESIRHLNYKIMKRLDNDKKKPKTVIFSQKNITIGDFFEKITIIFFFQRQFFLNTNGTFLDSQPLTDLSLG